MVYKCLRCGNTERFYATCEATEYNREDGTVDLTINGDGTIEQYGDFNSENTETTDSEYDTDNLENITCSECGGNDVVDSEDEEVEETDNYKKKSIEIDNWEEELK